MTDRNLKLFYSLETILSLAGGIILPAYVVYFRNFNITLFELAILAAVFEATIIIFEIPTGILADKFGRKLSTLIGFTLYALSALIFFKYLSFSGFIIAEIVFGIGESFISGALEALMVDSLDPNVKEKKLGKIFAIRTVFKTSALLIGMIIGGLLAGILINVLFLPVLFIMLIGVLLALFLSEREPLLSDTSETNQTKGRMISVIFKNRLILALFAIGLVANFVYEPVDQFWQVLFSEIKNVSPYYFGFILAAGLLSVSAVARYCSRHYEKLTLYVVGTFILMAVAIYLSTLISLTPAIVGIIIYFALKELIRPVISTHLNQSFNSVNRATFLSSYNLVCSVGEVMAGLTGGYLAARYGVIFVFCFSSIAALCLIFIYLLLKSRKETEIKSE